MKNILFINHSIRHGGPGKSLFYILKHIERDKIKPYVLIPADDVFSEDLKKEGIYENIIVDKRFPENIMRQRVNFSLMGKLGLKIEFILSILINIFDLVSFVFSSPGMLKRNNIDLIYCNGTVAKIVGAFIGLLNWKPVIWHVRNIQLKLPMIVTMNLLSMLPVIKKVICVSIPTAAQFKYSSAKTVVINNGVDINDFNSKKVKATLRREFEVNKDEIVIGTTGRIVPRKKYEIFIDIASKLKNEENDLFKKVRFAVVGNTPHYFRVDHLEVLKDLINKNGLSQKFIFTGYKDDIRPYLKDFDLFILTSDYPDPFPRSVIEAMAFSKPVIGFNIGGVTESVENDNNGYLCTPGNAKEMTEKIIELLKNKTKRTKMGRAGRKRIEILYKAEDRTADIQQEIIKVLS